MDRLKQIYGNWLKMKPIGFVLVTAVVSFLLASSFELVLELFQVNEKVIGGPKYPNPVIMIVSAIVLAPLIETYLFQSLPIRLTQRFVKWRTNTVAITISTLLFSLGHSVYSLGYSLLVTPCALFLALTYIIFQSRGKSSFWITSSVHSLYNLIVTIFYFCYHH